nr:HIV Tat-specific factor 1 homolog [Leptinotarsa decemlineata]
MNSDTEGGSNSSDMNTEKEVKNELESKGNIERDPTKIVVNTEKEVKNELESKDNFERDPTKLVVNTEITEKEVKNELESEDNIERDPTKLVVNTEKEGKNELESKDNIETDLTTNDISVSSIYSIEDIKYEGDIAVYTDPKSGIQYRWDKDKNTWVEKNGVYRFEDDTHVYTDPDGSVYFWDKEKSAWFPKVDDDFMARYQMNYGFVDNLNTQTAAPEIPKVEEKPYIGKGEKKTNKVKGEKRKASDPTWFELDETQNTNVYVSNLPTDIEEQEFVDFMQKCGMVMRDQQSGKFKVKLYRVPDTDILKGDALCTYIKIESVEMALKLLDGYNLKGHKIKVERAKFQMKGDFDPKLKPKMKKKKEKLKLKKQQEKLFDWRPEKIVGERAKHERVVIVKNLFDPKIFDTEVGLILEFQQDLREECGKYGEVRRVVIYDRHPEGIAQINMGNPEEADQIVNLLNGRWFMKRQLIAEIWDGRTKFKIAETDSEISQRLDKWDKFLDAEHKEMKVEPSAEENK